MPFYGHTGKDLLIYLKNHRAVYNGDTGLKNWKAALNRVKNGSNEKLNINRIGDSIAAGTGANATGQGSDTEATPYTNHWNNSDVGLLRTYLKNKYGDVGEGLQRSGWFYNPSNMVMTYTGAWTYTEGDEGFGKLTQTSDVGATATATFTGTGVRIFYQQSPAKSDFTIQIDGGSIQTVVNGGAKDIIHHVDFTGLTQGDHTIVITNLATSGRPLLWFHGIMALNATTRGVIVNNMGVVGNAAYQNYRPDDSPDVNTMCSQAIPANLSIIEIGVNDYMNSVSIANFSYGLSAMVSACKTAGSDVLLVVSGVNPSGGSNPWPLFSGAIYSIAQTYNTALIDFGVIWGGYKGSISGEIYSMTMDNIHPNITGHQDRFNKLINVIGV